MKVLFYNGQKLQMDIDFRKFRKFAYKNNIKYESWDEGDWIEMHGSVAINTIRQKLRYGKIFYSLSILCKLQTDSKR